MPFYFCVSVSACQGSTIVLCAIAGLFALIPYVQDLRWNQNRSPLNDKNDLEFLTRTTYYFSYVNCERAENETMTCPPGFSKLSQLLRAYKHDLTHPIKFSQKLRNEVLSHKDEYLELERREVRTQFIPMVVTGVMLVVSSLHLLTCYLLSNQTYKHILNIWFHWIGGTIMILSAGMYWRSSKAVHANEEILAHRAQNQAMKFYNGLGGRYSWNNTLRGLHACFSYKYGNTSGCLELKNHIADSGMCSNDFLKMIVLVLLITTCTVYYITCCVISCNSQQPNRMLAANECRPQAACNTGSATPIVRQTRANDCPPYSSAHGDTRYEDPPPSYESLNLTPRV